MAWAPIEPDTVKAVPGFGRAARRDGAGVVWTIHRPHHQAPGRERETRERPAFQRFVSDVVVAIVPLYVVDFASDRRLPPGLMPTDINRHD
jgi:hypothetical protein